MVCCVIFGFRSVVAYSCCLSVCYPGVAAVTCVSVMIGTGGAVVEGVHIERGIMPETLHQDSLLSSCTSPYNLMFSC